jgi:Uma2 family endonuclease
MASVKPPSSDIAKPTLASVEPGLSFADYLRQSEGLDERYELIQGQLIEMPPESIANLIKANRLLLALVQAGVSIDLIFTGRCEVQVPVLQAGDAANRYPDLIVVDEVHVPLMAKRATLTLEMPPPRLVVEVVSPGVSARERDYGRKRLQYAAIGVPEYWIIDPEKQIVTVLCLDNSASGDGVYRKQDELTGKQVIQSLGFSGLRLTVVELLR